MHEITALELGVALRELKPVLEGSFLKKFYDLGDGAFRMSFHNQDGNVEVYCKLLVTLNKTSFKEEVGEATKFAMAVRKRIEDSKVVGVYQHGSDRIAVLEFSTHEGKYRMLLEMFGKGNLVILNESGKIELCSMQINYRERSVRPGFDYVFPKGDSVDIYGLDDNGILEIMDKACASKSKMIVEISRYINIGPLYLDEIIRGAGLDPKSALSREDAARLGEAFLAFFRSLPGCRPLVYMEGGSIVDYSLVALSKYSGLERKEFDTLCEALDEAHIGARHAMREDEAPNKELEELNATIEKQRNLVVQFETESVNANLTARSIFENMNAVNAVIYYMQQNKRATIDEVRKAFPEMRIGKINLKDKKITLEL